MEQYVFTININLMEVVAASIAGISLVLDAFVLGMMHQKKKSGKEILEKENVYVHIDG
jgi:hypothetical protein